MRTRPSTIAISLSLIASAQFTMFAQPAFAQGTPTPAADAKPAEAQPAEAKPDAKPAEAKPSEAKPEEAKPAEEAEAPKADAEKPAAASDGTVEVAVDSPVPVSLERRAAGDAPWEFLCNSPCNQRTSLDAQYRIVGPTLNASKPFTLDVTQGDKVVLTIAPGVHNKATRGLWVLAGSAALAVTGVILIVAGSDGATTFSSDGDTHNGNTNFIFAGTALILAGVGGGVLGGSWLLDNRNTRVNGGRATTPEKTGPAKIELSTSSRQPTYNAPKTAGLPAFVGFPVLRGSF